MAIGTSWEEGSWTEPSWVDGSWGDAGEGGGPGALDGVIVATLVCNQPRLSLTSDNAELTVTCQQPRLTLEFGD